MVRRDAVAVARWGAVVVAGVGDLVVGGGVGGNALVWGAGAGGVWCERRESLSRDDECRGDVAWSVCRRVGALRE